MARISKLLRAAARQRVAKERKYVTSMNVTRRLEKATEHVARVAVYSVSDSRGQNNDRPAECRIIAVFSSGLCFRVALFLRFDYSIN